MEAAGLASVGDVVAPVMVSQGYVADDDLVMLFRRHCRPLVALVWVMLGDQGAAEEVVQEAFITLRRAWPGMRDPDRAAGYVRATAMNLARSRLRHRMVVLRHPLAPRVHAGSAEEEVMLREDHREVVAALRRLPLRQRECLALRHHAELTDAEIGLTLGISPNSVKTHLRRGIAALRADLEAGS